MIRRFARFMMISALAAAPAASGLDVLSVDGPDLVDPAGEVVVLRGVNLGNWLLLEPWMLGLDQSEESADGFPDQHTILAVLEERFGAEEADRLMESWRSGYVTPRDFEVLRGFGFNAVRLPIHHGVIENAANPGTLEPDGIRWVDRALEMAQDAGMYVILDLHGVPGGQSVDAPTGRVGQNRLWSDPAMQERTVSLWAALAARYADHPAVAAYDVVNEPFGDFHENVSPRMRDLFDRIHDAVRGVDPDTLLYAPGTLQGIGFYGDPAAAGWTNTGFTEHTYPGLFGQGDASLHTHADFLQRWVPAKAAALAGDGRPVSGRRVQPGVRVRRRPGPDAADVRRLRRGRLGIHTVVVQDPAARGRHARRQLVRRHQRRTLRPPRTADDAAGRDPRRLRLVGNDAARGGRAAAGGGDRREPAGGSAAARGGDC